MERCYNKFVKFVYFYKNNTINTFTAAANRESTLVIAFNLFCGSRTLMAVADP